MSLYVPLSKGTHYALHGSWVGVPDLRKFNPPSPSSEYDLRSSNKGERHLRSSLLPKIMHGPNHLITEPSVNHVIITADQAARPRLRQCHPQIGQNGVISVIAVDVDPVQ